MKRILVIFSIVLYFACNSEEAAKEYDEQLKTYIDALNTFDYNAVSKLLSDSIVTSEFEFITSEGKQAFYELFTWDSVFQAKYRISAIESNDHYVTAEISKLGKRIEFLHDSAVVYKARFSFSKNKIDSVHTFEYLHFDFDVWQRRRDSLVNWIDNHHPELNGFVFDQSLKGAENYLLAITLYKNEKE